MPKILILDCKQEISSFNPLQSQYDNFHVEHGDELFGHRGLNTEIGGALSVFDARRYHHPADDRGAGRQRRAAFSGRLAAAFDRSPRCSARQGE